MSTTVQEYSFTPEFLRDKWGYDPSWVMRSPGLIAEHLFKRNKKVGTVGIYNEIFRYDPIQIDNELKKDFKYKSWDNFCNAFVQLYTHRTEGKGMEITGKGTEGKLITAIERKRDEVLERMRTDGQTRKKDQQDKHEIQQALIKSQIDHLISKILHHKPVGLPSTEGLELNPEVVMKQFHVIEKEYQEYMKSEVTFDGIMELLEKVNKIRSKYSICEHSFQVTVDTFFGILIEKAESLKSPDGGAGSGAPRAGGARGGGSSKKKKAKTKKKKSKTKKKKTKIKKKKSKTKKKKTKKKKSKSKKKKTKKR